MQHLCLAGQLLGKYFPSFLSTAVLIFKYRYEVDREKLIGTRFFADVYRGTWRGRTVAIKVLAETTPRDIFKRGVALWASLQHPHVLELCGASSATGDPPWFFVTPYEKHGSLVQYLKGVETGWHVSGSVSAVKNGSSVSGGGRSSMGIGRSLSVSPSPGKGRTTVIPVPVSPRRNPRLLGDQQVGNNKPVPREWDLYRFMHEIAKGMEYLHANGVLHGDLKVGLLIFVFGYLN